jgi:hypothetical protein
LTANPFQVRLRVLLRAADRLVVLLALTGLGVPAQEHTHEPRAITAFNDLSSHAYFLRFVLTVILRRKRLARGTGVM